MSCSRPQSATSTTTCVARLAHAATLGADAVITSGGVSAGAYEVVRSAVEGMTFTKVAMQPGKPQGFAAGPPLVFGLPGNPVSTAVSFEVFVRPALLAMQGRTKMNRRMLRLPAVEGWRVPRGRVQYLPITFTNRRGCAGHDGRLASRRWARTRRGLCRDPGRRRCRRPRRRRRCHARLVSELAAILLAGGRGSRMGGVNKPLLEVGGTTLLDAAIAAAREAGCDPIVAVGDSDRRCRCAPRGHVGSRGPALRRARCRDPGRTAAGRGIPRSGPRVRSARGEGGGPSAARDSVRRGWIVPRRRGRPSPVARGDLPRRRAPRPPARRSRRPGRAPPSAHSSAA